MKRPLRRMRLPREALALLAGAVLTSCSGAPDRDAPPARGASPARPAAAPIAADLEPLAARGALAGANVLLVTLDTTRGDRMGYAGYRAAATPTLDRLASEGVRFDRATSVAPVTLPSHASILTGLYPVRHGARANGLFSLDGEHVTLAETLRDAGYRTGAVTAAFVLDARFGLAQGFDDYDDRLSGADRRDPLLYAERSATEVTNRALAWLARDDAAPFFLWAHYFDPHAPYAPPDGRAAGGADPYDGEIAYVDAELARLIDAVDRRDPARPTLVVVVGDHGESLHEHDEPTHGYLLYETTMHIPLLLRAPGRLPAGRERAARVSQVDVMPTVLALLGLDAEAKVDGIDLSRAETAGRTIFGETYQGRMENGWAALHAVYRGDEKYIEGPRPEWYDLAADPHERRDGAASHPERAAALRGELAGFFGAEIDAARDPAPSRELSAEERERLASLGYVFTERGSAAPADGGADPRRMMETMNRVDHVVFAKPPEQRGPEVIRQLEGVLDEVPDFVPGLRYLGVLRRANGDLPGAEDAFARAVRLHPEGSDVRLMLIDVRARMGKTDQAIADLRDHLAGHADDARGQLMLGRLLLASGADSALVPLRAAFALDPDLDGCADLLEAAYADAGRSAELHPLLDRALAADPPAANVRQAKAVLLHREGRAAEAEALLREGLRIAPDDPRAVSHLAKFLIAKPDPDGAAAAEVAALLDGLPAGAVQRDPELLLTRSQLRGLQGRVEEAIDACRRAIALAQQTGQRTVAARAGRYLERLEGARRGGGSGSR